MYTLQRRDLRDTARYSSEQGGFPYTPPMNHGGWWLYPCSDLCPGIVYRNLILISHQSLPDSERILATDERRRRHELFCRAVSRTDVDNQHHLTTPTERRDGQMDEVDNHPDWLQLLPGIYFHRRKWFNYA